MSIDGSRDLSASSSASEAERLAIELAGEAAALPFLAMPPRSEDEGLAVKTELKRPLVPPLTKRVERRRTVSETASCGWMVPLREIVSETEDTFRLQ